MSQQLTNPFETDRSAGSPIKFQSLPVTLNEQPVSRYMVEEESNASPIGMLESNGDVSQPSQHQTSFAHKPINYNDKIYVEVLEKRNEEMAIALEKQKIKNQHFEQALNLLKKEDWTMCEKLQEQRMKLNALQCQLDKQKLDNENLHQKYETSKAENNYLKELILLANKNYENLEQKYEQMIQKSEEKQNQHVLEEKNLNNNIEEMKKIITGFMKNGSSNPTLGKKESERKMEFGSVKVGKQEVQETYRKMFIKTLKAKKQK